MVISLPDLEISEHHSTAYPRHYPYPPVLLPQATRKRVPSGRVSSLAGSGLRSSYRVSGQEARVAAVADDWAQL